MLLVVTLLAFVVILLVGLAAYTRVETAVAGNTQRQAQARENALLALDVALAQLQQHAGPDRRVTATAESFGGGAGTSHYTGVWNSDPAAAPTVLPQAWLVSGNEFPGADALLQSTAITPASSMNATNAVALVSTGTSGVANDVRARLQTLTAAGVPGTTGNVTIGRYAWWVGDQGVKAPVAVPDATDGVTYPPFDSAELRSRLRQQVALGGGAADATGAAVFEPRDSNNAPLVAGDKVIATSQLAFLKNTASSAIGPARVRQNYFAWSPNNSGVLANTKLGGLRQDLSIDPMLLGSAFAAWADYARYMEDPQSPADPPPLPPYSGDPLRRRYKITVDPNGSDARVAPVLSYFYLQIGVQKTSAAAPYTTSIRWVAGLWNPYTSALVPEDLRLEIAGLPPSITIIYQDSNGEPHDDATVNLRALYGDPLIATLPWVPSAPAVAGQQSWLPGRVYNWSNLADAPLAVGAPNPGDFNAKQFLGFSRGLLATVPAIVGSPVNGNSQIALRLPAKTRFVLKLTRANGDRIATYTMPAYDAVATTSFGTARNDTSQFGFLFRLAESTDTPATPDIWLTSDGRDPRNSDLTGEAFVAGPNGPDPTAYGTGQFNNRTRAPERLLDRDTTNGTSYNEDVPLFELPRGPLLSLGQLQHFHMAGARPFSLGNSWGAALRLNDVPAAELFDRYFFSGLVPAVSPTKVNGRLLLPNASLAVLARDPATGERVGSVELRTAAGAHDAKFLLQSAFNVNSASAIAWSALLRGVRFPAPQSFTYLDSDPATGTASDAAVQSVQSAEAQFFRFSQSAQEVYKAEADYVQSTPAADNAREVLKTYLFRRGMRTLDAAQVSALAQKVADAIRDRHGRLGPFRSLEEFLAPIDSGPSLLEQAIGDANLNVDAEGNAIEFSAQFLTQADIMTALAPMLFSRSDTFVIRSYGEVVNPAAQGLEGRAWCEATVQRLPEYYDRAQPAETAEDQLNALNKKFGRRFKVVAFRWLSAADI